MLKKKIKELFLKRPITINKDDRAHKKIVLRGFVAASIYSVIYGIYEYFIVLNYIRLVDVLGSVVVNWAIMYICVILVVALATRGSVEQTIMGWFYMAVFEDVIFWFCKWVDKGEYPFPAGNWWDSTIASYRVLGGLGWAIPFWPYVPFYYIPGYAVIILYYITSYKSAKAGRIAALIWEPFFLAIIAGALGTDLLAIICLTTIPTISYIYIIVLLAKNEWKLINE